MIKEAENSLKIPVTFCQVHQERSVLSVCLDETCPYKGMFCYQCIKFHYAHLERTFEIKDFLNSVSEHINELSFDLLQTTPSPSIQELYRARYEQVVQNKENLLKEKELITEAISKYVQLAMESADKKLEAIEAKNPANQSTQIIQELTSYQDKFFDLANLQPEELYDMLVFFSRFIAKTSDDKIEIIKAVPAKNASNSSLPKQVAIAVEGDLDSTCQNLKNSQLVLSKLAGILEHLPPDDKGAPLKLNNLKVGPPIPPLPQTQPQQQQQTSTQQQQPFAPKRALPQQPSTLSTQERAFTQKTVNLNSNPQQQRSQIQGFEQNSNVFNPINQVNNNPRPQFNQSQVLANLPQFDKSSVSLNKSIPIPSIPLLTPILPAAPNFLQQFQQKLNENIMGKPPNCTINLLPPNLNSKPISKQAFEAVEDIRKPYKAEEENENIFNSTENLIVKRKSSQKIEVTSDQRLSLRSIEHFCDALEVNYNDTWCISFKVQEECSLTGLYHFPIFVYESSVGNSLASCDLEISVFEGNSGIFANAICSQTVSLHKTNCNVSTSNSILDQFSDQKETLLKVLEKIMLNSPLALQPNHAYTILFRNRTNEQLDPSKQLYILFGEDTQLSRQTNETCFTSNNSLVSFLPTNMHQFQSTFINSKLIVTNNDSLEDPQLTDYFVPFLALTHQPNQTPLKNINNNIQQNFSSRIMQQRPNMLSSVQKQQNIPTIQEYQQPMASSAMQQSQMYPQNYLSNYKPIGGYTQNQYSNNTIAVSPFIPIMNNNENEYTTKYSSRITSAGNQIISATTTATPACSNNLPIISSNNSKRKYQSTYPPPPGQVQNYNLHSQYGYNSNQYAPNANMNNSNVANPPMYGNSGIQNNFYIQNAPPNISGFALGTAIANSFEKNLMEPDFGMYKKQKR